MLVHVDPGIHINLRVDMDDIEKFHLFIKKKWATLHLLILAHSQTSPTLCLK
jgi:hypothetical protein